MGPGVVNSANTAIGRALRLCLINIGYCKAGAGDPNFIGLPTKFGMCLAENEEISPWPPYHVDQGFKRDDSAVTVVVVTGPTDIIDSASRTPEDTLNNIASMMFYRNAGAGGWIRGWQSAQVGHSNKRVSYQGPYHPIILSPSRAVILAEAGMSKQDAQAWLHRHCRISLQAALGTRGMPKDASGRWLSPPGAATSGGRPRVRPFRPWKVQSNTSSSSPAGRPTMPTFSMGPTAWQLCRWKKASSMGMLPGQEPYVAAID